MTPDRAPARVRAPDGPVRWHPAARPTTLERCAR